MFKGKFNHLIGIYIHSITYSNYPPRDIFIESIKSRNGFIFRPIDRKEKKTREIIGSKANPIGSILVVRSNWKKNKNIGGIICSKTSSFVESIESINSDSINRYPADWKKDKTRGIIFKIQSSNRGCSLFENILPAGGSNQSEINSLEDGSPPPICPVRRQ